MNLNEATEAMVAALHEQYRRLPRACKELRFCQHRRQAELLVRNLNAAGVVLERSPWA